jgi:hypothetical protein
MGAPLHCNTCVGGDRFLESWGMDESKWYCDFMVVGYKQLQTAIHIHIICMQSVLAP